jgi:hypothetical protein
MDATPTDRYLVAIAERECWSLLAARAWGRLAVFVDDHPEVFPVDHQVDDRTLLVRTEEGTKLRHAAGARVCFELDDIDDRTRTGWTVMVIGHADEVFDHTELDVDDAEAPLWTGDKVHWLRIVPVKVTGRRLVPDPASTT